MDDDRVAVHESGLVTGCEVLHREVHGEDEQGDDEPPAAGGSPDPGEHAGPSGHRALQGDRPSFHRRAPPPRGREGGAAAPPSRTDLPLSHFDTTSAGGVSVFANTGFPSEPTL